MSEATTISTELEPETFKTAEHLNDAFQAAELVGVPGRGYDTRHAGDTEVTMESGILVSNLETPSGKHYEGANVATDSKVGVPNKQGSVGSNIAIYRRDEHGRFEDATVPTLTGERAVRAANILRRRAARNLMGSAIDLVDEKQRRVHEIAEKHQK